MQSVQTSSGLVDKIFRCVSSSVTILGGISQQYISSVKMYISDGPWSLASIESLTAGFSVVLKPQTPPIAERSEQLELYPQLINHISNHSLGIKASKLWAGLGEPKGPSAAGKISKCVVESDGTFQLTMSTAL